MRSPIDRQASKLISEKLRDKYADGDIAISFTAIDTRRVLPSLQLLSVSCFQRGETLQIG